jgi:hypothetical protein
VVDGAYKTRFIEAVQNGLKRTHSAKTPTDVGQRW